MLWHTATRRSFTSTGDNSHELPGTHSRAFKVSYCRMGSPSDPRRRPILGISIGWGVVSLAEPFGVARPTKIWAHVENRSAEKVEYPLHISHEHCRQHHETLKLHHCQNKMG
jgi:hypothetical protein